MSCYENLIMKTQMNYSRHYSTYASGGTAVVLSKQKPLPYEEQIQEFVRRVQEAECIIVGGASGLSAAGGGDFYYSDTPSFREHFGKFADKYGFKGAFSGMMHRFSTRNEHWGYVATFLNTTQNAPIREPYLDLDRILQGKDFHILTTNQDTQFVKIYPEEKVSEIQGDHRFFQCSQCCQDETWDAVQPVADMIAAMGEGTMVPDELIPRCPHCGAEMFPWVRGYGNFLQGKKYEEEYEKISKYIQKNKDRKILLIELGVGRMTPMFIQEPFWELTNSLKDAYYISVNSEYQFLPEFIEDKGIAILGDIGTVLKDLRKAKEESAFVSFECGEGDHVHCFVSAPPKLSITAIVKYLKGISGRKLFERFPEIRNQLWKGELWNHSYYVETVGSVSEENIRRYIEHQSKAY